MVLFFFKQKTAYEMRISDWSSDVCSSDLAQPLEPGGEQRNEEEGADRGHDPDPVAGKNERRDRGQGVERFRPERDDRERQRRGVQPLPAGLVVWRGYGGVGGGDVGHAKTVMGNRYGYGGGSSGASRRRDRSIENGREH